MTQLVQNLTSKIFSPDFVEKHRKSEKDFTRNRSLTFPRLITFMLNMVNGSIQSELNRFFQVVHDSPVTLDSVSTAAFCKARKKFSHTAFKELNTCLIDTFYDSSHVKRWKGFRLLAVDGSVTTLPETPELFEHYGKARERSYTPAVRISQLYDVKNKLTIDLQVDSHKTGERNQAVKHLEYVQPNDLVLYDRGYPAAWFFILHQIKNIDFCARVTLNSSNVLKDFLCSGNNDEVVSLPCIDKSLRRCRNDGLPTHAIKVRLIRIELASGLTEILMTSLIDDQAYPYECFKDLYRERWGIEEDYKLMKSRLNIENFSGYSVESILQDIHAKVLTKNITAVAIIEADVLKDARCQHRKRAYKINATHALSQIKDNIVRFLLGKFSPELYQLLITKISSCVDAYRPDRKYKRTHKDKKYSMAYKRIG